MNARPLPTACLAVLVLVLGCGLALGGCGADEPGGPPDLGRAEAFEPFALYYAGDEIAGVPLEDLETPEDWVPGPGSLAATFYYGDCDPPSGLFAEGGCAPPAQIQNGSVCDRYPALSGARPRTFELRGARAHPSGGGLEIVTGRTTVVIFALGEPNLMKPAIRQLRQVGEARPPKRLPPPVPGAVQGKLPCQQKRG